MALSINEIKLYSSLSTKKGREENGLFIAEGEKMVSEALASDFKVHKVLGPQDKKAIDKISSLSTPPSSLAVIEQKKWSLVPEKGKLYLALDSVRDPGNMGTIIRVADWFGIDGILASEDCVDIYNPKVVQATMGAIFRVPFIYCDLASALDLKDALVYGTFLDRGARSLYKVDTLAEDKAVIIVLGNESNGISDSVGSKVTERVFIPPFPAESRRSESLNVAIAASICISHFRQLCIKTHD